MTISSAMKRSQQDQIPYPSKNMTPVIQRIAMSRRVTMSVTVGTVKTKASAMGIYMVRSALPSQAWLLSRLLKFVTISVLVPALNTFGQMKEVVITFRLVRPVALVENSIEEKKV